MGGPATKLGSLTGHGGVVIGPGCSTVYIENSPAIRVGIDKHACPMITPGTPPIPHIGMNNVGMGVPNVIIGGYPASTVGDYFLCAGSPPAPVVMGAVSVFIGTKGPGSTGENKDSTSPQAVAEAGLKNGTLSPIKGTEIYPVEIQAIALVMQQYCTPEGHQIDMTVIDALAQNYARKENEQKSRVRLTISDIVDILKYVESEEGYEAARFFASELNFNTLCDMAKMFISGKYTDSRNDPNIMPTRFMILYGADDSKLKEIDSHTDNFDGKPEHKLNVVNLQKALIAMGNDLQESSFFDEKTFNAFRDYISLFKSHPLQQEETHSV